MPFLSSSLQNFELDQLEAIAALWGLGPFEIADQRFYWNSN